MKKLQSKKYLVFGGSIVNRNTGNAIPPDEPVFILRAQDKHAIDTLVHYAGLIEQGTAHHESLQAVIDAFDRYAATKGVNMKEPDTITAPDESVIIIVNGRRILVGATERHMTREAIIHIAYGHNARAFHRVSFTLPCCCGENASSLSKGESVYVEDGMDFHVMD